MLAPVWIVEVDGVSGVVILMLERCEEVIDDTFFGPVAVKPCERRQDDDGKNHACDLYFAPTSAGGIERLGIEQRHVFIFKNNAKSIGSASGERKVR